MRERKTNSEVNAIGAVILRPFIFSDGGERIHHSHFQTDCRRLCREGKGAD
jgi:hypothetical protein